MKLAGIVLGVGLLAGGDRADEPFLGHWQSDQTRTLLDMDRAKVAGRLTEQAEANEAFYRDGFFGRLRVHYEPGRTRAWFPDEGESADDVPWGASRITHVAAGRYVIVGEGTGEGLAREFRLDADGECYSVEITVLGFAEWFCRVRHD